MNIKRFLLAALAVFVTFQILDYLIHMIMLSDDYEATAQIWRTDMMDKMYLMYINGVLMSLLFVYFFAKGNWGKSIVGGLHFGFIFGLLISLVMTLNQYIVYPIPLDLFYKWFIYGLIEVIIAGVVVFLIYKPKTKS